MLNLAADSPTAWPIRGSANERHVAAIGGRAGVLRRLLRNAAGWWPGAVRRFVPSAFLAPLLAPHDPLATDWSALRQPPSARYWFGTDDIGRDVLSRVIWGSRASLMAGVVSVLIAMAVGVPLGACPAISAAASTWC